MDPRALLGASVRVLGVGFLAFAIWPHSLVVCGAYAATGIILFRCADRIARFAYRPRVRDETSGS